METTFLCGDDNMQKEMTNLLDHLLFSSGGRTRTYDLRVMSPTSYQLLYSAISLSECKGMLKILYIQIFLSGRE